jgi:hypothetical protein
LLYEIVLCYPNREHVVLSETPLDPGSTVELAGRSWIVLESIRPMQNAQRIRFICGLSDDSAASAKTNS